MGEEYLNFLLQLEGKNSNLLNKVDINPLLSIALLTQPAPIITNYPSSPNISSSLDTSGLDAKISLTLQTNTGNLIIARGVGMAGQIGTDYLTNKLFDLSTDWGRSLGTIFSQGSSAAMGTLSTNLMKGLKLTEGLGLNVRGSVGGALGGIAANYIGRGVLSAMGNSKLGKFTGGAVSSAGGTILGGLLGSGSISIGNPYAFAANVIGNGLINMNGPSKEYGGKHGNITRTMDTIYDGVAMAANVIPGYGLLISAGMTLNKGLSNIFGSTSGMTTLDAILGSAFMPAPVKWLNMAGAKTTGSFNNLSWQNMEKANSFMGNAFGDLASNFDKARQEAGKTYGTFSRSAYRDALRNMNFANYAWDQIMAMADLNELLNIRSLYMSSINNLKYALDIQGSWLPIYRGKSGMKIFNNATNHNMGMRLLSAAALIDSKQMILSAQGGTKFGKRRFTKEEIEANKLKIYLNEREAAERRSKANAKGAEKFNKTSNTVMEAMTLQANETPFTGQEYLQAAEDLRQEKVEKFNEAEKIAEAAMMADLAVSAAPLLLRGFRWVFNKAGLLVKVPLKQAYSTEIKSPYYKIGQDGNLTFDTKNVVSQIRSGKQDFINETLSPEYAEAAIRNMEEAEKMGLFYTPVFEKSAFKSLREDGIIPKFVQDPKHTWHARTSFFGGTPGKATEIEYNLSQPSNIRQATGHESGHVSRWGMGETKEEQEFMKYKASLIFEGEGDVGVYQLGSLTGEAATNMRDLGKQMGITQKTPYPGYEEALKRLKEAEVTSNKGGIVKVLKLTKEAMPHIWRALQGLHFEYAIPLTTAATLYNTNK